jgi:hypothetical protein
LSDGSTLSRIADTKTAVPRGTGHFTDVFAPVISGKRVAFLGLGQPFQGGMCLAAPSRHDLALVKITAPKLVTQGSGPQPVKVQIQNRGNHDEVITSASLGNGVSSGLVRLDVSALGVDDDAEKCQPAAVALDAARNAARFKGGSATSSRGDARGPLPGHLSLLGREVQAGHGYHAGRLPARCIGLPH